MSPIAGGAASDDEDVAEPDRNTAAPSSWQPVATPAPPTMSRDHGPMTYADGLDGVLAEQVAYYRAGAPE